MWIGEDLLKVELLSFSLLTKMTLKVPGSDDEGALDLHGQHSKLGATEQPKSTISFFLMLNIKDANETLPFRE